MLFSAKNWLNCLVVISNSTLSELLGSFKFQSMQVVINPKNSNLPFEKSNFKSLPKYLDTFFKDNNFGAAAY